MSVPLRPTVLCVDDEPLVLEGLELHLHRSYAVLSATSGIKALGLLGQHPDTAVIISDMRMPLLDGAAFLARARQLAPDAVRIVLTGHADVQAAMAAVNKGHVFRFLSKPCPPPELIATVEAAVAHHELITSERVLLERTLRGCIEALTEVLALTTPGAFGRAIRLKQLVAKMAAQMQIRDSWQVEVAAMLSQLGAVVLPAETADKWYLGKTLTETEQTMISRVPAVTQQLLAHIPRLDAVRDILAAHQMSAAALRMSGDKAPAPAVTAGAQVLRVAVDFDELLAQGHEPHVATGLMRTRAGLYEGAALDALDSICAAHRREDVREVPLSALRVGMVVAEDVRLDSGLLLVARGYEVTSGFIERARNFPRGTITRPLRVSVPQDSVSAQMAG